MVIVDCPAHVSYLARKDLARRATVSVPVPSTGRTERRIATREPMNPVAALCSDFERITTVVVERLAKGVPDVNAPLPISMPLEFRGGSRRPFGLFVDYLAKPGLVVARSGNATPDSLIHGTDPKRLSEQYARPYLDATARILRDSFGPALPDSVAGPKTLQQVLRHVGACLIADASRDADYGRNWQDALEASGVDRFGFLCGPVASRVVDGAVGDGTACSHLAWNLKTGHALLSVIVDAIGEGAVGDFADDLLARCALAKDRKAPRRAFETIDGRFLVAIMGLERFSAADPHDPPSLSNVFGDESESLARWLRARSWLWAGNVDDATRPVTQRLAELVLREIRWLRRWDKQAQNDVLLDALREDPDSFPRGLGRSGALPSLTSVAPNVTPVSAAADQEPQCADSEEAAAGAFDGFRLLHPDQVYGFRPITIGLLGMSGVGKTTFVNAVLHYLLEHRSELFHGADALVLADRTSEAIRDGMEGWRRNESPPSTPETVQYVLELPRLLNIGLVDSSGGLLALRGEAGTPTEDCGGEADRILTETMARVDGLIAFLPVAQLFTKARSDHVSPEQRTPEVDVMAERLGRVMRSRRSDHVPVALVLNKLDSIVADEDSRAICELGSVFGGGVSGGYLPRIDAANLSEWAERQPVATRSLAAQSAVTRTIEVLDPVFAQLAAYSRRIELFFTTSRPVKRGAGAVSSDGPAAVVSWILGVLIPAFLAQAKVRITKDRQVVAAARTDLGIVRSNVRLIAIDPRAGAVLSLLPGMSKVTRKLRARRIAGLNETLRRYGMEVSKEPSNDELFEVRDRLEARIDYSTSEIDAMESRLDEFAARFQSG